MGNRASHSESLASCHSERSEESRDPSLALRVTVKHSLFITFEGGEGSGKSTQARALHRRLRQQNIPAVLTHEPGSATLGNELKRE